MSVHDFVSSSLRAATMIATTTRFRLYTVKPLIPRGQPYRYSDLPITKIHARKLRAELALGYAVRIGHERWVSHCFQVIDRTRTESCVQADRAVVRGFSYFPYIFEDSVLTEFFRRQKYWKYSKTTYQNVNISQTKNQENNTNFYSEKSYFLISNPKFYFLAKFAGKVEILCRSRHKSQPKSWKKSTSDFALRIGNWTLISKISLGYARHDIVPQQVDFRRTFVKK